MDGFFSPSILAWALAASVLAKTMTDVMRGVVDAPSWASPATAALVAFAGVFLIMLSTGVTLDTQTVSQGVIAGLIATGSAVGVTEIARAADSARATRAGE